ncbi:hypothetical protein [Methylocapsa palsarum]|uniref:PD-(D/E)XK nuclease superfamily protein n=1 Tax=Methylocapsa palsarum TaxID=1612308 RepID=A0A1I3XR66_9HYPH|nr:hypothetical protein [Methylocapsa palsarum]SFK21973.1 hypothetical protein SAMN05444581_10422 [Methylocapsa palsarum]
MKKAAQHGAAFFKKLGRFAGEDVSKGNPPENQVAANASPAPDRAIPTIDRHVDAFIAENQTFDAARLERRRATLNASECVSCARRVRAGKDAVPPDPHYVENQRCAFRGQMIEAGLFAPAMRGAYGRRFRYGGARQHNFSNGRLAATPDGLLLGCQRHEFAHLGVDLGRDNAVVITECKSVDDRTRDLPKNTHVVQVQIQLGLVRETSRYKPDVGIIIYLSASFLKVTEIPIRFDPAVFAAAERRARLIMGAASMADLPAEGRLAGGGECQYCPYVATCGACGETRIRDLHSDGPMEPRRVASGN